MESHINHPMSAAILCAFTALNFIASHIDWSMFDVAFITPAMHLVIFVSGLLTLVLTALTLFDRLAKIFKK